VLIGIAARPRQVPDARAGTRSRAQAAGSLARLELSGLSADEARELLGEAVTAKAAATLYEESSGNPFYLQQLARSPRPATLEGDGRVGVAMAGVEVPQAVAAALTGELALLSEDDRRVLEGAAVAGDPFEPELAAAAAGVTEDAAIRALDELLARDLIRHTEVPRRFRFRHPLVRGAVYEAAPGGWRITAHERAATALAERGAPTTARAHHVERSARHGDMEAVALLRDAALAAVPRAPATAGRLFEAALRLLPENAPVTERAALLDGIAGAYSASGWFERSYNAMRERLDLPSDEPLPHTVRLIAAIASLENLIGRNEQAHARLVRALDELPDQSSEEAVAILIELGIDGFFRMDYRAMWEYEERALEAATAIGDKILMATPAGIRGFGQVLDGRFDEAAKSVALGAELIDGFSEEELSRARRATNNIAATELYLERYADAARHSERALAVAVATGQGQFVPILFWTGIIRLTCGRLADAAELQEVAIDVARLSGHAQGLAWNLCSRSLTATAAGDVETALALAEEAVEAAGHGTEGPTFPAMWIHVGLASALLETGDGRRACEIVLDGAGGDELPLIPAGWRPSVFELLTRASLVAGSRVDAVRYAERSAAYAAEQTMLRLPRTWSKRAAAEIALADGDAAAAAPLALDAAAAAAEIDAPIEDALSRMLAGRALAAAGKRDEAAAELQRAGGIFENCGALLRRDAADRELGKLGKRVHRRTKRGKVDGTGIELLTERELEVARLVVDRKTNAQIAAELFLSPKTVETHIRHLFQKLEVSSRVEVARVVERADREAGTLTG